MSVPVPVMRVHALFTQAEWMFVHWVESVHWSVPTPDTGVQAPLEHTLCVWVVAHWESVWQVSVPVPVMRVHALFTQAEWMFVHWLVVVHVSAPVPDTCMQVPPKQLL